jgi:broad specificity phosphatase PhoE
MLGWLEVKGLPEANLPRRVTFLSHAPTAAVAQAAFPADEAVDPRQLAKIGALGWVAPRAHRVYAGPERRTRETASALGLQPQISAELRELGYGRWQGRAMEQIHASEPEGIAQWLTDATAAPHGGESIAQLTMRVEGWLGHLPAGHTVAVTHPALIRAAVLLALRAPAPSFWRVEIAPLTLTDLRQSGTHWTVRCSGCRLA